MAWIESVDETCATGDTTEIFTRLKKTHGGLGNFGRAWGLRPHMLETFMRAYKQACFHPDNALPPWYHEAIATYVSVLNGCGFCVAHHTAALLQHAPDKSFAIAVVGALAADDPAHVFVGRELAGLLHVRQLTLEPTSIAKDDIQALRDAGYDDGEILEINQTAGVFAWANRYVSGLGVSVLGEALA